MSNIKKNNSSPFEMSDKGHIQTPGTAPGDSINPQEIEKILVQLNRIFDRHAFKYKNGLEWRKAIIENLAAWRLGIKYVPKKDM